MSGENALDRHWDAPKGENEALATALARWRPTITQTLINFAILLRFAASVYYQIPRRTRNRRRPDYRHQRARLK